MANSVVANVDDVTAGYWNPAGLVEIEAPFQVMAMHSELFAGIAKYDYIGIAKPLKGSVKIIRRVIGTFGSAWGFGIDLGLKYKVKNFKFALVGRDITSTFNAWSFNSTEQQRAVFIQTDNDILESSVEITRPRFILGAAWEKSIGSKFNLLLEGNFDFTTDGQRNVLVSSESINIDPHAGFELGFKNFIFLRGGVINFQQVKFNAGDDQTYLSVQPNFGLGLKLGSLTIDYAYTNIGSVSEVLFSNVFSLKLDFKSKKSAK